MCVSMLPCNVHIVLGMLIYVILGDADNRPAPLFRYEEVFKSVVLQPGIKRAMCPLHIVRFTNKIKAWYNKER